MLVMVTKEKFQTASILFTNWCLLKSSKIHIGKNNKSSREFDFSSLDKIYEYLFSQKFFRFQET